MTLRQREQVASISLFLNRPWLNYNPDHRRRGCNSTTEYHSPPPNHSYIIFLPHPRPPPLTPSPAYPSPRAASYVAHATSI